MTNPQPASDADAHALTSRIMALVSASWQTQALHVAAQLRLPDLLAAGPQTVAALAAATGSHAPSLLRLLRALTTLELCKERADGAFELAPLGGLLRSDVPNSIRSWALFWGGPHWTTWGHLLHSVQTGETARKHLSGTQDFQHLAQDPALAALFNQVMVELTRPVAQDVARMYDFSGARRIVDVGGGSGELLTTILQSAPAAQGVIFDMAHAREGGLRLIAERGLSERCQAVTGSFFESVPGPADICLLKSILHDWYDDRSQVILENCRKALAPGGKVLVIERIMPEQLEPTQPHRAVAMSDLNMLVGPGGQERTEQEFRTLLAAAGLRLERVIPTGSGFAIVEAVSA